MRAPKPDFAHLLSLSGPYGTYEHADHAKARVEHGYCTDDVARALLVASRESEPSFDLCQLASSSLEFLRDAQALDGRVINRRSSSGAFFGPATAEDCWGRTIWALGTVIARSSEDNLVDEATQLFERSIRVASPSLRAMAFATFGAAEVLNVDPANEGAHALIIASAALLDRPEPIEGWRWCENQLSYANAALPEAMMAAGAIVGNDRLIENGLRQLQWLLDMATSEGYLSVTPAEGRSPKVAAKKFDQQPIEVAAISEACLRANVLTGDVEWTKGHELAVQWFLGDNDLGTPMFDPDTGGGFDGLTATGPNLNQGAESTIALLTTLQQARHFEMAQ
jgi:uncharacterized protein YyaL (SSP411 family)